MTKANLEDMSRDELIERIRSLEADRHEADCDGRRELANDDSDWCDERRVRLELAPSEYDSCDSKGRPLKPSRNDAGEPWWM